MRKDNAYPLAVGGWKDHVHIFFELLPDLKISDLVRMVKASSSKWINDNSLVAGKFQWQEACLPVGRDMGHFHTRGHNAMR